MINIVEQRTKIK